MAPFSEQSSTRQETSQSFNRWGRFNLTINRASSTQRSVTKLFPWRNSSYSKSVCFQYISGPKLDSQRSRPRHISPIAFFHWSKIRGAQLLLPLSPWRAVWIGSSTDHGLLLPL
jgi:hypothetical protein